MFDWVYMGGGGAACVETIGSVVEIAVVTVVGARVGTGAGTGAGADVVLGVDVVTVHGCGTGASINVLLLFSIAPPFGRLLLFVLNP